MDLPRASSSSTDDEIVPISHQQQEMDVQMPAPPSSEEPPALEPEEPPALEPGAPEAPPALEPGEPEAPPALEPGEPEAPPALEPEEPPALEPEAPPAPLVRELRLPLGNLLGNRDDYNNYCVPLHQASVRGDWGVAEAIFTENSELVRSSISENCDTALHIAASTKCNPAVEHFVENLMGMMNLEDLRLQNKNGNTALSLATAAGNLSIVEALVNRDSTLLDIPNCKEMVPLYIASLLGNHKMVNYLYGNSHMMTGEFWTSQHRGWVLSACVEADFFDVALRIVTDRSELANNGHVLGLLAQKTYAFKRSRPSINWLSLFQIVAVFQQYLFNLAENERDAMLFLRIIWTSIVKLSKAEIDDIMRGPADRSMDDEKPTTSKNGKKEEKTSISEKEKQEEKGKEKGKEKQEEKETMSEKGDQEEVGTTSISILPSYAPPKYSSRVLFIAAEMGNTEFIVEIIRQYPDLMWKTNDDNQSIFHVAVLHRQEGIYNLLHETGSMKELITPLCDNKGNNMLHLVGKCPSKKKLQDISGAALQMQRELQWFKEVKEMMPPSYRKRRNNDGLQPHELFTEEHKELMFESEKWMKNTSSKCMVVATLIATVVFAAAFTIPGGFDQRSGIPLLLHKRTFIAFLISDAISLSFAAISILMFLSILTSRYAEQDFLVSLPAKLMQGLATLFFSIVAMMVAFSVIFFAFYDKKLNWIPLAISGVASLPVILYGRLQRDLLADVFLSTFGSKNLFKSQTLMIYYHNPNF